MRCPYCNRELKDDSRFCDICGREIQQTDEKQKTYGFNYRLLAVSIGVSILVTILVSGTASIFGLPLLFGGLFLPFFWKKKK